MGGKNKVKKTKWRVLDIADDHNSDDSEESNLTSSSALSSSGRVPSSDGYHHHHHHQNHQHPSRPYSNGNNKYSYSSQSTPQRRRQPYYEGSTKSTRSSSTTSETKITVIDDEYTRITTPRQDVLFKKGYLNKPRQYQSQTSTGASTISTETSTENGTPDHQSTDLDYESHQFVFPNGFVDHNGIYYVNSYEPYPLMLFNPPTYFHEFSDQKCSESKTKRYSTGSLTESMSPNTEEATSQDLSHSGGDTSNNVSDYGGQPLYNLVYPGYYVNSTTFPHNGLANGHSAEPVKKLRKRRERKSSKTVPGDSTENTTDENSSDEVSHTKRISRQNTPLSSSPNEERLADNALENPLPKEETENSTPELNVSSVNITDYNDTCENEVSVQETKPFVDTAIVETKIEPSETLEEECKTDLAITQDGCADSKTDITQQNNTNTEQNQAQPSDETQKQDIDLTKSTLKPEAEEFVPRVYQTLPPPPPAQILPHPNFVPIPLMLNDFNGSPFGHPHPAFIPPGIPIPIIPHHKMFPPVYGPPPPHLVHQIEELSASNLEKITEDRNNTTRTPESTPNSTLVNKTTIDIATVVSKLEEAVKEREENLKIEEKLHNGYKGSSPRFNKQPYRRNFNKYKGSPLRNSEYPPICANNHVQNEQQEKTVQNDLLIKKETNMTATNPASAPISNQNNQNGELQLQIQNQNTTVVNRVPNPIKEQPNNSPEHFKKRTQYHTYQSSPSSPGWQPNYKKTFSYNHEKTNQREFTQQRSQENRYSNKNYSELLKKPISVDKILSKKHISEENKVDSRRINSEVASPIGNHPNQWISVSSRKKKKNKNMEEIDFDNSSGIEESISQNEDFESYDVNQLIDVIPPSNDEKKIVEILTDLADKVNISPVTEAPVNMINLKDIESEMLVKTEEKMTEIICENKIDNVTPDIEPEEIKIPTEAIEEEEENKIIKKKSKKGTQKPLTKKVIIKDIDLSGECEQRKPKIVKDKEIKESKSNASATTGDIIKADIIKTDNSVKENSTNNIVKEVPEKKSKKKKKNKAPKPTLNDNWSDSNATLSTVEDSCDLLLENSLLNTSLEKTNDEMTLELDKLIQRSMFSSLKEKIRSTDLDLSNDGFFHKLGTSNSSKNGFNKTPDFNKVFQSTRQFLKPNSGDITNTWILPATDNPHAQPGQNSTASTDLAAQSDCFDKLQNSNRPNQATTSNAPSPDVQCEDVSTKPDHEIEVLQTKTLTENPLNQLVESQNLQVANKLVESVTLHGSFTEGHNDELSSQSFQTINDSDVLLDDLQDTNKLTKSIAFCSSTFDGQNSELSTEPYQKIDSEDQINQLVEFQELQDSKKLTRSIALDESTLEDSNDDLSNDRLMSSNIEDSGQPLEEQTNQFVESLSNNFDECSPEDQNDNLFTQFHQKDLKKSFKESETQIQIKNTENYINSTEMRISQQDIRSSLTESKIIHNEDKVLLTIEENEPTDNPESRIADNTKDTKKLYPITAAVKNWMTRTREVTPEVELLKSPSTIYKELRESQEREKDFFEDEDEEIVIFKSEEQATSRKSCSPDLLEYWDNEIPSIKEPSKEDCIENKNDGTCACAKCQQDVIEEGIEVYESKYGKNETYLNLKDEVHNKNKTTTGNRYGGLPPRAVCCNVQ